MNINELSNMTIFRKVVPHLSAFNEEMSKNIGRTVKFKNPNCPAEKDIFKIVGIQKNYKDEIIYRVVGSEDVYKFGRCAHPNDIKFC